MYLGTFLVILILTKYSFNCQDVENKRNSSNIKDFSQQKESARIINEIMKDYIKIARPKFGESAVDVNISVLIKDISSVNESEMEYKADFLIRHYWIDPRLAFAANLSVDKVTLSDEFLQSIWLPDSFYTNGKSLVFHQSMTSKNTNLLQIRNDGRIFYSTKVTLVSQCAMDFTYFPVDQQVCSLQVASYGYSDDELMYHWSVKPQAVKISPGIRIPKFKLMGFKFFRRVDVTENGNYSRLECSIALSRSTNYYISRIFVPVALIVTISWIPFWLDHNDLHARVALGVTTVLTMITLTNTARVDIPQVSYIKAVDIYLFVSFIVVFLSLIEYAIVGYLMYRINKQLDQEKHQKRISRLIRLKSNISSKGNENNNSLDEESLKVMAKDEIELTERNMQLMQTVESIDYFSRCIFPAFFVVFNSIYFCLLWSIAVAQDKVLNQFIRY